MSHIGLGVQFSTNKCDEGRLGLVILHILEDTTTLGNDKDIRTDFIHNIIADKFCGGIMVPVTLETEEMSTSGGGGRFVSKFGEGGGVVSRTEDSSKGDLGGSENQLFLPYLICADVVQKCSLFECYQVHWTCQWGKVNAQYMVSCILNTQVYFEAKGQVSTSVG